MSSWLLATEEEQKQQQLNVSKIFFLLPQDVLLDLACRYLTQRERFRFFASCKWTLPSLHLVRTLTLTALDWVRFVSDHAYRRQVLKLVGCPHGADECNLHLPVRKTRKKLKVQLNNKAINTTSLQVLHEYQAYVLTLEYKDSNHSLLDAFLQQHPSLRTPQVKVVNSSLSRLQYLSQLVVNLDSDVLHLDLLTSLNNEVSNDFGELDLASISWSAVRGVQRLSVTEDRCFTLDINPLATRLEEITLVSSQTKDISFLAQMKSVSLHSSLHVKDISALRDLVSIHLFCLSVQDIRPLQAVSRLHIDYCFDIQHFPIPSGQDQQWNFSYVKLKDVAGFGKLLKLTLNNCYHVKDLSALGTVRYLDICSCASVKIFPTPVGINQEWYFYNMRLPPSLTSLRPLRRLQLFKCDSLIDISALGQVPQLLVEDCPNIRHFPVPSAGPDIIQDWSFTNSKISDLTGYGRLHSLVLRKCEAVVDVTPLASLHSLTLEWCDNICDVSSLSLVKILNVVSCLKVTDVSMLSSVEELSLQDCSNVLSAVGLNVYGRDAPVDLRTESTHNFYSHRCAKYFS